jgi:hypothetical protein
MAGCRGHTDAELQHLSLMPMLAMNRILSLARIIVAALSARVDAVKSLLERIIIFLSLRRIPAKSLEAFGIIFGFSLLFVATLAKLPFTLEKLSFNLQEVEMNGVGLCLGLASGITWGLSILGKKRWNSFFNFFAAGFSVVALGYLAPILDCNKVGATKLCAASKCSLWIANWLWSWIAIYFSNLLPR